jgi:hypothetical protein
MQHSPHATPQPSPPHPGRRHAAAAQRRGRARGHGAAGVVGPRGAWREPEHGAGAAKRRCARGPGWRGRGGRAADMVLLASSDPEVRGGRRARVPGPCTGAATRAQLPRPRAFAQGTISCGLCEHPPPHPNPPQPTPTHPNPPQPTPPQPTPTHPTPPQPNPTQPNPPQPNHPRACATSRPPTLTARPTLRLSTATARPRPSTAQVGPRRRCGCCRRSAPVCCFAGTAKLGAPARACRRQSPCTHAADAAAAAAHPAPSASPPQRPSAAPDTGPSKRKRPTRGGRAGERELEPPAASAALCHARFQQAASCRSGSSRLQLHPSRCRIPRSLFGRSNNTPPSLSPPRLYSFEGAICCWDMPPVTLGILRGAAAAGLAGAGPGTGLRGTGAAARQVSGIHAREPLGIGGGVWGQQVGAAARADPRRGAGCWRHQAAASARPRPAGGAAVAKGPPERPPLPLPPKVGLVSRDPLDANNLLLRCAPPGGRGRRHAATRRRRRRPQWGSKAASAAGRPRLPLNNPAPLASAPRTPQGQQGAQDGLGHRRGRVHGARHQGRAQHAAGAAKGARSGARMNG